MFGGLFGGKQKTPQEMLREHQRVLRRSIREMDRERAALQRQEKTITMEIKKMAKQNQLNAVKIMAKDLVRTRANIQKFFRMKSQLQAVSLRIQTLQSTAAMAGAMTGVTRALMAMNQSMNLPAMQRIMMEFEKQSEIMDMKEEMMEDTMEDIFETDEDEDQETEEVISKVLAELGCDLTSKLSSAPGQDPNAFEQSPNKQLAQPLGEAGGSDLDADLQARLNNLRKDD